LLLPQQLYWYARAEDHEQLEKHNLFDCIECGACSYVCPSHIPLVQYYRASKGAIRDRRLEEAKAERARLRFEARQERIEKAKAEKEARRAARKRAAIAKAADNAANRESAEDDPIQAAIARAQAKRAQQGNDPGAAADTAASAAADNIARIEKRLAKAKEKLAADTGDDPTISAALQKAVETTTAKLDAARSAAASETGENA
jgi:electron transport complex protein RnfC